MFIPLSAGLIAVFGWRNALLLLAALHLLLCVPLHALCLRDARAAARRRAPRRQPFAGHLLRSAPFLLIGVFVVGMMGITAAIPPHLISLLRESGLREAWVIAIPASIGVMQVVGRLLLYFFEHRFDLHVANRLIPFLIPLALGALLAGAAAIRGAACCSCCCTAWATAC